jgi:hypothetical protein
LQARKRGFDPNVAGMTGEDGGLDIREWVHNLEILECLSYERQTVSPVEKLIVIDTDGEGPQRWRRAR